MRGKKKNVGHRHIWLSKGEKDENKNEDILTLQDSWPILSLKNFLRELGKVLVASSYKNDLIRNFDGRLLTYWCSTKLCKEVCLLE